MRTLAEFKAVLEAEGENRDLRSRPSGLGIALFDSIHHVDARAWESVLTERQHSLRPRFLAALEAAKPEELRFRYWMLFDGRRPVAVGTAQVLELTGDAVGRRAPRSEPPGLPEDAGKRERARRTLGATRERVARGTRRVALNLGDGLHTRLLVCGNVFLSGEHGLAHVPDVDPADVFRGAAEALYRLRRADKLHGDVSAVLVKDFFTREGETLHAEELLRFDYRAFEVDPAMVVPLDPGWSGFDDYTAAMTSKYRSRARSARKKGAALRREELDVEGIEGSLDRIQELLHAVAVKASFRLTPHPPGYFPELKRALGEDLRFTAYSLDDLMVGFGTTMRFGDELEGHFLGLDYEHNLQHAVYQNILYDDVEQGIEARARNVWLGRTALEIKSGIGAIPRPARCFVRHPGALTNRVLKPLFKFLKPAEWTPRSPFPETRRADGP